MSFTPLTLVWWFVLHLGSERNWDGVTAARLPRLAHEPPNIQPGRILAPDGDAPIQEVSLSESLRSPASSGAGNRPRDTLWQRMLRGMRRPSRHRPPSGGHVRELENEVQETDEAALGPPAPSETLDVEEPPTSSSSSLTTGGGTGVGEGAAGGKDHPRWIDMNYPFFQAAVETIDLDTRRTIAELLRQYPRTKPNLSDDDMQFTSSLDQYLPDPFIVEPYSKRGDFSFSFRREELLGIGGNAVIYKVREDTTERTLAMKIFRVKSEPAETHDPAASGHSGGSSLLRRMAGRTAKKVLTVWKAFGKGGGAEQLLVEDFITVPVAPPGRVRGLPDVLTVDSGWRVFNSLGLYEVAETDLLHFVSRHQLTRSMRENLTREMVIGLAKVHAYGMSHRDVKPENMLIYSTGQLSFTDFDGALPFKTPEGVPTQIDCARRSPGGSDLYFAPEVAVCDTNRGTLLVTPAADSWALGMSLYFLWCERYLYPPTSMRTEELLRLISSLTAREQLRLSFRGCHSMSPHIMSLIEGLLEPEVEKRLTPLHIVSNAPFFLEKSRPPPPPPRRVSATGTGP